MEKRQGKIIKAADVNVWDHEMRTAESLARAGYTVEFVRRREGQHEKSADCLIDGMVWEMKAPKSERMDMIQKNLRRALHQSHYVIIDSQRVKKIPDAAIERELRQRADGLKSLKRLVFVNRKREIVIIK